MEDAAAPPSEEEHELEFCAIEWWPQIPEVAFLCTRPQTRRSLEASYLPRGRSLVHRFSNPRSANVWDRSVYPRVVTRLTTFFSPGNVPLTRSVGLWGAIVFRDEPRFYMMTFNNGGLPGGKRHWITGGGKADVVGKWVLTDFGNVAKGDAKHVSTLAGSDGGSRSTTFRLTRPAAPTATTGRPSSRLVRRSSSPRRTSAAMSRLPLKWHSHLRQISKPRADPGYLKTRESSIVGLDPDAEESKRPRRGQRLPHRTAARRAAEKTSACRRSGCSPNQNAKESSANARRFGDLAGRSESGSDGHVLRGSEPSGPELAADSDRGRDGARRPAACRGSRDAPDSRTANGERPHVPRTLAPRRRRPRIALEGPPQRGTTRADRLSLHNEALRPERGLPADLRQALLRIGLVDDRR